VYLDQPTFVRWLIDNCKPYSNSPLYPCVKYSIDHFRKVWFFNPLNANSLRLTKVGFQFCTNNAEIENYRHNLNANILPKTLLQMEKYFPAPYYINYINEIRIFDERTSMTLILYNNDLQKFLDNISELDK
jgi:hypothetical protein